jgi:hypothetical protein
VKLDLAGMGHCEMNLVPSIQGLPRRLQKRTATDYTFAGQTQHNDAGMYCWVALLLQTAQASIVWQHVFG